VRQNSGVPGCLHALSCEGEGQSSISSAHPSLATQNWPHCRWNNVSVARRRVSHVGKIVSCPRCFHLSPSSSVRDDEGKIEAHRGGKACPATIHRRHRIIPRVGRHRKSPEFARDGKESRLQLLSRCGARIPLVWAVRVRSGNGRGGAIRDAQRQRQSRESIRWASGCA